MVSTLSPEVTDSNDATDISRSRRYRVLPEQSVPVAIQRFEEEEPASGELIDISVSGARIRSKAPLRFGETLVLHLESKASGLSITISCEVQWIRASQGEWIVGCRFEHNLEGHLLEDYVERGLLERRETDRFEISLPASARFEISGQHAEVDMTNVGTGGFCFLSLSTGRIGSRVSVNLDRSLNEAVEGRIMWHSLKDGMYLVGCQWVNRKGIDFAKQLTENCLTSTKRSGSRTIILLLSALIIAGIAFALGALSS
jgi:hypothetical protein